MAYDINDRKLKELMRRYAIELKRLESAPTVDIELHPQGAIAIISAIQLACRHPANNGWTRENSEFIARQLMSMFPPDTAIRKVLDMGWKPELDAPGAGIFSEEVPWSEVPEELRKQGEQVASDIANQLRESLKRMGLGDVEIIPVNRPDDSN